jgi:hypothetical protein
MPLTVCWTLPSWQSPRAKYVRKQATQAVSGLVEALRGRVCKTVGCQQGHSDVTGCELLPNPAVY